MREEFNKPFSYHPYLSFFKGSCKVHDEPFQPGLNCLHAFFSVFQPGLMLTRDCFYVRAALNLNPG